MKSGSSSSSKQSPILSCVGMVAVSVLLSACTPDVVSRSFKDANTDFGPTRRSDVFELPQVKADALPTAASIVWRGDAETAAWFRTSEDIGWLARRLEIPSLGRLSYSMRNAVVQNTVSWGHTVVNSAYASAAIGETREDSRELLASGIEMLKEQERLVVEVLQMRNAQARWPLARVSLVEMIEKIDEFLIEFVHDVQSSNMNTAVSGQIADEFRTNFGPKLQRIKSQVALAYREPKIYDFIGKIRDVLREEDLDLGRAINARLETAQRLPRDAEKIHDAKSALSVLIDFWNLASPEIRVTKFKVLAPELYDFFNGQSPSDLQCVRTSCGPITWVKKTLFILPQIEKFGISKIRQQLTSAAEESIRTELEMAAIEFLPDLHTEIASRIRDEMVQQRSNLGKISEDYAGYFRNVLKRVATAKLGLEEKDLISGVEPSRIFVDLNFGDDHRTGNADLIRVTASGDVSEGYETGAAAIGAGLASAIETHDFQTGVGQTGLSEERELQMRGRIFFEQICKVLMIGGFATEANQPFDSFAFRVDGPIGDAVVHGAPRFDLRTLLPAATAYAVPDRFFLREPASSSRVLDSEMKSRPKFSVAGQAELLRGLSRFALSVRDWQATSYDRVLGPINIADFVPDLPRASIDRRLFPKDLFYAAAIGNAGALLQNLTKPHSTLGLIEPNGQMHWGDEGDPAQDPTQKAISAVLFDLENGIRAKETKIVDVARFLSALVDFHRATNGIEQSSAESLTKPDANGKRPVDMLISARTEIGLLIMGLANFLSSEAIGPDGLVHPDFHRTDSNQSGGASGEPRLMDQAIVIRALVDASEAISAAIYRTAALDLLADTDRFFFRASLAFYSNRIGRVEMPDLETQVAMLVAGERLRPYSARARAAQWSQISRPWINALRDAAEMLP